MINILNCCAKKNENWAGGHVKLLCTNLISLFFTLRKSQVLEGPFSQMVPFLEGPFSERVPSLRRFQLLKSFLSQKIPFPWRIHCRSRFLLLEDSFSQGALSFYSLLFFRWFLFSDSLLSDTFISQKICSLTIGGSLIPYHSPLSEGPFS